MKVQRIQSKFFILLVTLIVLLAYPCVSSANQIDDIRKELAQKKKNQKKLKIKANLLNKEVRTLKKDLVSVSKKVQKSEANILANKISLKDSRERQKEFIAKMYQDQQSMGGIVSAARKYSKNPILTILSHDDILDAARTMIILKSAIPNIDKHSEFFKSQLMEINNLEFDITKKMRKEREYQEHLNTQQGKLAKLIKTRRKLYAATEHKRIKQKKLVAILAKKSNNLEELLNNIKTNIKRRPTNLSIGLASASIKNDNTRMPVQGTIKTQFNEEDVLGAKSRGITFTTISSAKVITPFSGIVKFAGPFKNYKKLLIIEHPQGYHSLIAGLNKINTVVGANLAAGEPVGVSDSSEAPRIYYELRKDGKPINPQKMLLANKKQGKS